MAISKLYFEPGLIALDHGIPCADDETGAESICLILKSTGSPRSAREAEPKKIGVAEGLRVRATGNIAYGDRRTA